MSEQFVSRSEMKSLERIPRSDVHEGARLVAEWSPYSWARESEEYVGRHVVEVTEVHDLTGDIRLETDDGRTLKDLGESRAQVMGSAENHDGVPDWTDVGRGARYYKIKEGADL